MPIIHFTAADAMSLRTIPGGIYPSEVTSIDGPKKSSTLKSFNYFADIQITDGPYKGKARTICFNTGSASPSLLGEMQFFPDKYLLLLIAAIEGKHEPEMIDKALDIEALLHKPFDASWGTNTVDGRLINTIDGFHPAGYAKEAPAF
jgi:hypothetical protein